MTAGRYRHNEKAWQHWQRACEVSEAYRRGYEQGVRDVISHLKVSS